MLQRRFGHTSYTSHKLVVFSFQRLLPDAVLLQDLAGNLKLHLVDVSGPKDRTEGGRLLLLSCKKSSLSPLLLKKSSLSPLLLKESSLSPLLLKESSLLLLFNEGQSLSLSSLSGKRF